MSNDQSILVSIIIPCYNVQDYIEECVLSCIEQSLKKIEIICVNNNSTDNTYEVLKTLADKYAIIVIQEKQKGACAARNKGLAMAKGKWINFLDADDLLLPKKLEHQLNILQQDTDVLISDYHNLFLNGGRKKRAATKDPIMALLTSNFGCTCSNLWLRKTVITAGKWNPEMSSSQDYELLFRLIKNQATFQFDEKSHTIIRSRESGQISQGDPTQKWLNFTQLRCEVLAYLEQNGFEGCEKKKEKITLLVFNHVRSFCKIDLDKSTRLYQKYFSYSSLADKLPTTYRFSLKLFGFKITEQLYQLLNHFRAN